MRKLIILLFFLSALPCFSQEAPERYYYISESQLQALEKNNQQDKQQLNEQLTSLVRQQELLQKLETNNEQVSNALIQVSTEMQKTAESLRKSEARTRTWRLVTLIAVPTTAAVAATGWLLWAMSR